MMLFVCYGYKMNTMGMVGWLMYNDDERLFVCLFVCLFVVDSR